MFQRACVDNKDIIKLESTMPSLPESVNENEKQAVEQLLELTRLIAEKFTIENVKARYNRSNPDVMSVIFEDSVYVGRDKENKRPVDYLKAFSCTESREDGPYPHLSKTVVSLPRSQCTPITLGLKLLISPTAKEVEDRSHARMYAKC